MRNAIAARTMVATGRPFFTAGANRHAWHDFARRAHRGQDAGGQACAMIGSR
jgi:hypothetical protein